MRSFIIISLLILINVQNILAQNSDSIHVDLIKKFLFAVRSNNAIPNPSIDTSNRASSSKRKGNTFSNIKYIKDSFLLADTTFSSGERSEIGVLTKVKKEITYLKNFLSRYPEHTLQIRSISIGKESPYELFSDIQRKYTYVVLSETKHPLPLLYIFIIPSHIGDGKVFIYSWQLVFTNGRFSFQDVLGARGLEFLLE